MYFSQTAMDEAYFMTNATPQISYLNRGGFKALESKFRKWIIEFKSIIIISGCTPKITESHIGKSGIPVPKFFYKIFIDPKNKRSIAFLFPNAKVTQDLFDYVVSIDYLESVTGLDFFYKLSDEDELSFEIDTGNKK
jgi:endonuclease G